MTERKGSLWSIAIYTGPTPLDLSPAPGVSAPVLTADDVHDISAAFVADPFMVLEEGCWYLFCEAKNQATRMGEIGAAISRDGFSWRYLGTVLRAPFHLSYPQVFRWEGEYYMVPETLAPGAVTLYRANRFPFEWQRVASLVEGVLADPTLFRFDGLWWMFACPTPHRHDSLCLFHSEKLTAGWRPHPMNPLLSVSPSSARPGGRVVEWDGRMIRLAQDCVPVYGSGLRAFEIDRLDPDGYSETEARQSPILQPDAAWNASGMHHADPHCNVDGTWRACVDGYVYIDP